LKNKDSPIISQKNKIMSAMVEGVLNSTAYEAKEVLNLYKQIKNNYVESA
jgi:hypothetical protein